ncbi:MAG: 4-hydroxy-tetrahydrodipicolinate reductase [Solirubrobacterales bacterium]|nr:4-hydroxy-tetrahydrodipicolinate reductase [Solirubrobacterales bacterium]
MRVVVSGAAGRMGATVCEAVEGAPDMELVGRADPSLGVSVSAALASGKPDVVVDFTIPSTAVDNIKTCLAAGVDVVVGTSGWDQDAVRGLSGGKVLFAPNFAIGAVLMMKFAAEAAKYMPRAEIIELHHDKKLDKPSGTAARTAELIGGDPVVHSVRLPGLVAHQEVILGDVGQTLTIRHDSIDRHSFMPGVLLAIRRVGSLEQTLTVGLEHVL